jgi:hypothetical protein
MAIRAETINTVEEFCRIIGSDFTSYDVGLWQNDEIGRLSHANKLPQKRGIYTQGFVVAEAFVPFYGGRTAAKAPSGLRTRMRQEYNKKCATVSQSGPYKACLHMEYYELSHIPIRVLFRDMSDKTDDEIAQAEAELLKTFDFCANIKDNGVLRLDDLVTRIKELSANTKPFINIVEEAEEAEEEVEEEIEVQTAPETSDDYNRKFYMESSEFLSEKVLKEIHVEAMRIMHKFKADKVKEYLSDKVIAECAAKALC